MRTFCVLAVMMTCAVSRADAGYTPHVLGLGPGCAYSEGVSINDEMTVLCESMDLNWYIAASMWNPTGGWSDVTAQDVLPYAGVNNLGQMVVEQRVETNGWHWFRPFVRNADGDLSELLVPSGATDVWPSAINQCGQVGASLEYRDESGNIIYFQAAILDTVNQAILVPMPSPDSWIASISDSGYAVLTSGTYSSTTSAYIWAAAGGLSLLPGLTGAVLTEPWDVNDSGTAVGTSDSHAVKWDSEACVIDLGLGFAHALNNAGQIVGALGSDPVLWDIDDSVINLGLPEGASSAWANAINDNGVIVGGATVGSQTVAVLWQPVPEPSSLPGLLCGLGGAYILRRRRGPSR
jgi:uncharacterized membrane protein